MSSGDIPPKDFKDLSHYCHEMTEGWNGGLLEVQLTSLNLLPTSAFNT